MYLPLANVLHHKLRSLLSATGIAVGVCMLLTLSGLSRGSLFEIADRWESVDAELIAYPRLWGENITTMSGIGLSDRYREIFAKSAGDQIQDVVPVFLWQGFKLAGQDQVAAGVDADQFARLTGGRKLLDGTLYRNDTGWDDWMAQLARQRTATQPTDDGSEAALEITSDDLRQGGFLELVIDSRLARAGHYSVGDHVQAYNHTWRIAGIVEAGALTRVFMPRRTAQFLFGSGDTSKSTLMFIKLRPGVDANVAAAMLHKTGPTVVQVKQYRAMLQNRFAMMLRYVDVVNVIALVIAFLFIMTTLYTMVLQRTREIAILKSCGASGAFVVRQVLAESLLLTALGTSIGIGLGYASAWGIETFNGLLTVKIGWDWLLIACAAALCGAVVSAVYPAWRATRVDMIEALTLE